MKMDKNTKTFLAIGMILAFSFVAVAVTMEDESDALSYTYVDNYSAVQLNQRYMTSHTSDTTVKKVDFPTITGARVYTSDSYSTQVVEDTGTYTTENSSIISGAVKRIYFIPTATNVSITMRWTTSSDWFDWSHSETFVFTTNPTEYGNWRTGSSSGTTITSLTMEVGDSSTVYFTSPVSLTNATFSSSSTSVASITSSSIGTQYYWTVNLHANAAGTSTIRASYSSGTSIYYKDLSITVNQPISTTFYRNYTSTDSTVIDTITQTVGSSFSLPSDPIRSNYTFSGWYTARSGGTQITSSTTVTSSSPTTLYAHWNDPTEYGNYKSGSYSGTTITSLAMKVGQTTTVYFTSAANISNATFTSSNSSIVHVDSTDSGTVYQRSITLTANATGTVTLKAQYMSGSTAYYKDLSITVTEISTKFYRNNSSSDTNVVATISQVVGDYFDLPSDPVRQGYTFTGWYTTRTGGTQITSSTTVTTSSPTAVYAHWGEPSEYGTYKSGSYSGTTITSLAMKVGETTTVYFTSPVNISSATFTSSNAGIVHVDSTGSGTVYQRSITLTAYATGTVTLKAQYSSGSTSYYKDLSITVTQLSTTFYRNYDSSDSTVVQTVNQTVGSSFSLPSDPVRQGYTFTGWYTTRTGGTQITSSTTVTTSSPTALYAHWGGEEEYGAYKSGSYSGTTITSLTMKVGETTTVYFTSPVDITNATFTSSNANIVRVDSTGTGTIYQRSIVLTALNTGNVTLKAQYSSGSTSYYKDLSIAVTKINTLFYRNYDSSDSTVIETIGQTVNSGFVLPADPVRQGYTFTGWYTARSGGTQITTSTTVTTSSPTAVYAQWGGEVEYGAYKSGSYSGTTITSLAMKVGETTTVYFTSPVDITGATFTSSDVSVVRIDSTGTGTIYQRSIVLTALSEGTVTLKAEYSGDSSSYYKNLSITVTQLSTDFYRNYDSSDNVILDTINQTINSTFVIPSDPTREGFTFAGWFTARENGTEVTSSTTVTTSSPTILYAHWESPQEIGAYKTGSYSGTVINSLTLYVGETKTIYFTSPVDISSATFTSSDSGILTVDSTDIGTIYQRSITITAQSAGEVTLRADYVGSSNTQYFKNLPITVTYLQTSFYVNHTEDDPTVLATINQPIGSYYNLPINPNRPGYNFSGWFTARDGGSEVDSATTVTTSSPTSLYAHWTAKTFVVSFNASANGGTVEGPTSKPVTYNQPYGLLPSAKKTGNVFLGWFDATSGGNQITESTIVGIVADQTLYAQFEERDVLVWWDNGYVNGSLSIEFDFVTTSDNYTHEMEIPLVIYDGIEDDADGIKYFSDSGYTLSIVVPYNGQITCTLSGHGQTISDSFKSGSWVQFTLDVDAQNGTVTFRGTKSLGWNTGQTFTFTNYETVFTKKIFDFSSEVTGLAISKIYHEDTGTGTNHPRFQVSATTTFLDTYGFVMIDPTLNIYSQFPNYDNLRLNLYSFAVYGETMTVNGHQFTVDGSKISDLYYTVYEDENRDEHYVIAASDTPGALLYDATLSNIYITWTNISSNDPEERQCYLTFANDKMTFEMGSYAQNDLMISFTGIWYFTTALYEPYLAHETVYSMDWGSWFNLDADAFILIIAGLLIILTVAFSLIWKPSIIDYAIILGTGLVSYILLGGL